MKAAVFLAAFVLLGAAGARAQDLGGHVSALFSVMPDVSAAAGREAVPELRTRLFLEGVFDPTEAIHVRAGAYVEGLVGDRRPLGGERAARAAIVRPGELYLELRRPRFDLRAGMSRVVWGRLDEFQPTDVVNPVDLATFLLEGRSEARLPVPLVRTRLFLPAGSTLEGIVVPVFTRGRFDRLDEDTSPFLLAPPGIRDRREPAASWRNLQGGARLTSTIARLDWGVSAWRGFEPFPLYVLQPVPLDPLALVRPTFLEVFPRFTMIGADFETVRGAWGLRGEAAWFDGPSPRDWEGGVGADRRAGDYRVAVNLIVSGGADVDATLVGWAERTFARETRSVRLLAAVDPADETAFVRAVGVVSLRDNVSLEGSAGVFTGGGEGASSQSTVDALGLLAHRDFMYVRLKVHF